MSAFKPLNPYLWEAVRRLDAYACSAGDGEAYDPGDYELYADASGQIRQRRGEPRWRGEYYRFNCPFCGDTKHRAWVNHKYGTRREESNDFYNRGFWGCYNEHCENREDLRNRMVSILFGTLPSSPVLLADPGIKVERVPFHWPGYCFRIHDLSESHFACRYLRKRGYSPTVLGTTRGVRWCETPTNEYDICQYRLIIPIWFQEELVGWQARRPSDYSDDSYPKYNTMPGMRKSRVLYNFDNAVRSSVIVLVEGIMSVWVLGDIAVSALGRAVSVHQIDILSTWWQRFGKDATLVVLFDPDVDVRDEERASKIRTLDRMRDKFGGSVLDAVLPYKFDHGTPPRRKIVTDLASIVYAAGRPTAADIIGRSHANY